MFKFSKKARNKFKFKETCLHYNKEDTNGLIIGEKYIPQELLCQILFHVDHKTLLACQLVCKNWYFIIQNFVWHNKTEFYLDQLIPINKNTSWLLYYFICDKLPFEKNLIKNHSGEMGVYTHWIATVNTGNVWDVECSPDDTSALPNDPVFEGRTHCFIAKHHYVNERPDDNFCYKYQIVDLVREGFSTFFLDNFCPKIKISEWVSCSRDCPAIYTCVFELIGEKKRKKEKILSKHQMTKLINKNGWIKIENEFQNYGKGLRKIKFAHSGRNVYFWDDWFKNIKMAGACVKIENPLLD